MSTKAELACVYASLILVDDDVAVTVSWKFNSKRNLLKFLQSQGFHFWNAQANLSICYVDSTLIVFICYRLQGEKISTILKAANVDVEPYWPGLFAKALEGINVKDLISNIGSGVGSAPAGGAAAPAASDAPAAEAKKEEKKKEEDSDVSDDDMGFGLFD